MAGLPIDWNNLTTYPENDQGTLATSSVQLFYYSFKWAAFPCLGGTYGWDFGALEGPCLSRLAISAEKNLQVDQSKEKPKYSLTQRDSSKLYNGRVQKRQNLLPSAWHYPLPNYHLSQSHALKEVGEIKHHQHWRRPPSSTTQGSQTLAHSIKHLPSPLCGKTAREFNLGWCWTYVILGGLEGHKETSITIWASMNWVRQLCGAQNFFCFFQHKAANQV